MQALRTFVLSLALLTGAAGVAHAERNFGGNMGPGFGRGHEDRGPGFRDRGPWRGGPRGPGRGPGRGDDFGRGPGRGGPGWGGGHGGGHGGGGGYDGGGHGGGGGWDDGQNGGGWNQGPGPGPGPGYPGNVGQLIAVYRSYTGYSHFWSLDANEGARAGFQFEGVAFTTAANGGPNMAPLFRCYTGATHFASRDAACEGQRQEGTLGNVAVNPTPQMPNALHRCYNGRSHLVTSNVQECYNSGYGLEGVLGYVR